MKKICIFFLLSIIISLTAIGCIAPQKTGSSVEYLRIHVRANSNSEQDQNVKYTVKDGLVCYLTPIVASCESKTEAVCVLGGQVLQLQRVAQTYLRQNGFEYEAKVEIREEWFPTRVYEGYTLPADTYTAIIVELGEGKGDNWWCVVYPPLCFTATPYHVQYKSKILEIIENWKNR